MTKQFGLSADEIEPLARGFGSCFASDRITVDCRLVGYMYRELPDNEHDSGWRFFAGDEDETYCSEPANFAIYDVNTVANYDPAITEHLNAPIGSAFAREGSRFRAVNQ